MKTNEKFILSTIIFSLVICIAILFCGGYYQNYVKPRSYVIGEPNMYDYVPYKLKEYISEGDLLFCMNINDVSFKVEDGTATYAFQFAAVDFDADTENYLIYVNEDIVSNIKQSGRIISGAHETKYLGREDNVLADGTINIQFASQTNATNMVVSMSEVVLPYFTKYCSLNNYIITLAKTDFALADKVGKVDNESTSSLTIDLNNGTDNVVVTGITGMTYVLKTPANYNNSPFVNWTIDSGDGKISNNIFTFGIENTVITAHYDSNPFEIKFVSGDETETIYVSSGTNFVLPENPTKDKSVFIGWSLDGVNVVTVQTINITSNATYIAVFEDRYVSILNKDKRIAAEISGNGSIFNTQLILNFGDKLMRDNTLVDAEKYKVKVRIEYKVDAQSNVRIFEHTISTQSSSVYVFGDTYISRDNKIYFNNNKKSIVVNGTYTVIVEDILVYE